VRVILAVIERNLVLHSPQEHPEEQRKCTNRQSISADWGVGIHENEPVLKKLQIYKFYSPFIELR